MKAKFDIVNSETAAWPSGKAEDCKSFIPSSNLGAAFEKQKAHDEDYTRDLTLTKGYRVHTSRSRSHLSPLNPPILMLLANLTLGNYRQFWGTFAAPQNWGI